MTATSKSLSGSRALSSATVNVPLRAYFQVVAQGLRPLRRRPIHHNVFRPHRGVDSKGFAGTREQHIEAAPATLPADGSEILAHCSRVRRLPKRCRDNDRIALIALDVFQVLYEQRLTLRGPFLPILVGTARVP